MLLQHLFGANLFVAFICDPLNLNLFPPHVSGVAVGGAGSGVVSDGNEVMDRSSFLKIDFQVVLSVHSKQGHCHTVNKKKKRKKTGRRRRGRTGLGVRRPLQITVPFVAVKSSTTRAELGSWALPFTLAQQLLKNSTEAFIRLFVCIL